MTEFWDKPAEKSGKVLAAFLGAALWSGQPRQVGGPRHTENADPYLQQPAGKKRLWQILTRLDPSCPGANRRAEQRAEGGGGRSRLAVRVGGGAGGRPGSGGAGRPGSGSWQTCHGSLLVVRVGGRCHMPSIWAGLYRERSSCLLSGRTTRYGSRRGGRGGGRRYRTNIVRHQHQRILYGTSSTGVRFPENYFF
jgi:hypothetical protein